MSLLPGCFLMTWVFCFTIPIHVFLSPMLLLFLCSCSLLKLPCSQGFWVNTLTTALLSPLRRWQPPFCWYWSTGLNSYHKYSPALNAGRMPRTQPVRKPLHLCMPQTWWRQKTDSIFKSRNYSRPAMAHPAWQRWGDDRWHCHTIPQHLAARWADA